MNLGRYVSRSARYYRDRVALQFGDRRITYGELDERTNRLACGLLALGLTQGDRVAVQAGNRPEIAEVEVACYKAGLVRVPINARLSPKETLDIVENAEVKVFIGDEAHIAPLAEAVEQAGRIRHFIAMNGQVAGRLPYEAFLAQQRADFPAVEVDPADLAVLTYSSGTSGKIKGIMQSFGNRLAMIRKALMFPEIRISPGDKIIHVGPITHVSGMLLMPFFFTGGCNVILHKFDMDVLLETIEKEKINYTMMVPTMINVIVGYPKIRNYRLDSLKALFYGAAPISPTRVQEAIAIFGPILVQGYGMSETTSFVTVLTANQHVEALRDNPGRLASCGRPVFETEVKVVREDGTEVGEGEVGEIIARGADVMQGYYRDPEQTAEKIKKGWIHSGDMARVDEEGFIYIVDRKTDMIISGGFNIYPSEIEQVLYRHPAVFEACVVGVPDEKWGEAVKALVVLKPGAAVTEEALIDHCVSSLGAFKKPKSVAFVTEFPKTATGKIARRQVREPFWAGKVSRVV